MKNENLNQTENVFEMEEITNDTKSEAEPKITITIVRTFCIKLFRQDTVSLFKFLLIPDEFIRRLEIVGGWTRVTLTGGSPLNIAGFLSLAPGAVFIS
mgnify:CR=1 FL=1